MFFGLTANDLVVFDAPARLFGFGTMKLDRQMPSKFKTLNGYMATMHEMDIFKTVVPSKDVLARRYKLQ